MLGLDTGDTEDVGDTEDAPELLDMSTVENPDEKVDIDELLKDLQDNPLELADLSGYNPYSTQKGKINPPDELDQSLYSTMETDTNLDKLHSTIYIKKINRLNKYTFSLIV